MMDHMKHYPHDRQVGFTLIEMMIVVAIIGILVAIAIPMYKTYRQKAYNAAAISDVYQLYLVENEFFNDNGQFVPVAVADKQANGAISKSVTLANGTNTLFQITGLTLDVDSAANVDATKQTIIVGAKHHASPDVLAVDLDDGSGYRYKSISGSFSASILPAATNANDLANWPLY